MRGQTCVPRDRQRGARSRPAGHPRAPFRQSSFPQLVTTGCVHSSRPGRPSRGRRSAESPLLVRELPSRNGGIARVSRRAAFTDRAWQRLPSLRRRSRLSMVGAIPRWHWHVVGDPQVAASPAHEPAGVRRLWRHPSQWAPRQETAGAALGALAGVAAWVALLERLALQLSPSTDRAELVRMLDALDVAWFAKERALHAEDLGFYFDSSGQVACVPSILEPTIDAPSA